MALVLGIDLGTTGCKAAVYDEGGECLGERYLECELITRSPVMVEQDPNAWWELTCQAINGALDVTAADRQAVQALSISSQGISFVLLDEAGLPLGNAINWLDARAMDECETILQRCPAEKLFAITGRRAAPFYVLPKLLWIKRHQPGLWHRTRQVAMGHDYLVYRLCGTYATDHSMAGGTLLYDLEASGWSTELLEMFDIPRHLLPDIYWSGVPVGTLRPEVANALGLPGHTVVSVGGQDQKCAALGAGIREGTATVSLGTAAAIVQVMEHPRTDPLMRIPTCAFVCPDRWVLEGVISTGGGSLRWYRQTLGSQPGYQLLDEEASHVPMGAEGVLFYPHLSGAGSPLWIGTARGIFYGLSIAASRGHMVRAILEGIAYQIRENLEITQELAGTVEQVIVFGGGARSEIWREIICNVVDRPLAWTTSVETACLGAAMLAGLGGSVYSSLSEARESMVRALTRRNPDRQKARAYSSYFQAYCSLERRLLETVLV